MSNKTVASTDSPAGSQKYSSGLSERNLHTARALVEGAIQPTPVRGRSLCDAKAGGATLELLDGTDCLPTSLRTGIGLFTAAALRCAVALWAQR